MKTQILGFGRLGRPFSTANYTQNADVFEFPVSQVQPNMALTIKEIFSRYIQRQPLPDVMEAVFSDIDLSGYDNMSKVDKAQAAKTYAERVNTLNAELLINKQKAAQAADKLREQSAIDFAVKQKLDEISSKASVNERLS